MAKLNMQSATARRSLVIKLVDDALIHSQNDLGVIGFDYASIRIQLGWLN